MLRSIHLTHFKSFADAQVTLSPFTVWGDGQGDLLDALRVVQGLARGYSLAEALRGGTAEAIQSGSEPTQLTLEWEIQTKRVHHPLSYALSPHPHILSESLGIPSDDLEPLMVRRTPGREHENTHGLLAELDAPLMMLSGLFKEESVNALVALREVIQRMELLELSAETEERIRTAPRGSIILIEELEPRLQQRLEFLENVTRERGLQIIATAHSPPPPALTAQR
jgi:hypothetical protein